jgi:hypothetical protein
VERLAVHEDFFHVKKKRGGVVIRMIPLISAPRSLDALFAPNKKEEI